MIVIIDTGLGNITSVANALNRLGYQATITHSAQAVRRATRVILPGVGHASAAMVQLEKYDLIPTIRQLTCPVLGICLGMQLLFDTSEEGDTPMLSIISGAVTKLPASNQTQVPHMGWNNIHGFQPDNLFKGIENDAYLYFVHSYAVMNSRCTIAKATHAVAFAAAVQQENFFGCQFHPERSGETGLQILNNFMEINL